MKVRIKALHKYWDSPNGKLRVLENLELSVEHGDFIAVMGPSGCGKSSLLHLLGCIDTPTFGQIFMQDQDIVSLSEVQRERLRLTSIGFVFQNYNLLGTLNAQENVSLPMQLNGVGLSERQSRGMGLLQMVGLEARAEEEVNNLSGGQQQRVAIARALANLPGLLLAGDEPTGNLDNRSTQEVMDVLQTVNVRQQLTTIMVTHDPKVAACARRIYLLDEGRLRRDYGSLMARLRIGLTVGVLLLAWSLLVLGLQVFYDGLPHAIWLLPPLGTALQWLSAPAVLRALYRINWCPPEQFEALYRERESYLRVGVVDTDEPWAMTYGHSRRRVDVVLTSGLLKLFEHEPDELNAILARELYLGDSVDLGAASALAAPLVWCGVTDEFLLGHGRRGALQRGLGGGLYLGLAAHALYRLWQRLAAMALRGRQAEADGPGGPAWRAALRRLTLALQAPQATEDQALRRGYGSRQAILGPVDVEEAGRLVLLDPAVDVAAALSLSNPWERREVRFHRPLGRRLGLSPQALPAPWQDEWKAWQRHRLLPVAGFLLAVADVWWRRTDLGVPCMALGLIWLAILGWRYRRRSLMHVTLTPSTSSPWSPRTVTGQDGRWLALDWPSVWSVGVPGAVPAPQSDDATGWLRHEAAPYLELQRIGPIANRAPLYRALLALALTAVGVLINLAAM